MQLGGAGDGPRERAISKAFITCSWGRGDKPTEGTSTHGVSWTHLQLLWFIVLLGTGKGVHVSATQFGLDEKEGLSTRPKLWDFGQGYAPHGKVHPPPQKMQIFIYSSTRIQLHHPKLHQLRRGAANLLQFLVVHEFTAEDEFGMEPTNGPSTSTGCIVIAE